MSDTNVQEHRELALKGIPLTGLLSQEQATTVLRTIWKGAPDEEVYKAARLCQDFGLHPLMKHVYLIEYKGQKGSTWTTVLGIGATRLMMSRQGTFSYTDDTPRVMSEEEQKRIFGKVDTTNVMAITKLRTKDGLEAQGYGRYPKADKPMGVEKGNSVENMAFIRSERNAFGRLYPDVRMPTGVDVVDEQYMSAVQVERVDTETGEILNEQSASEAPLPTSPQKPAEAPSSPTSAAPQPMSIVAYQAWQEQQDRGVVGVTEVLGMLPGTWLNKNKGMGYGDIVRIYEKARGNVPVPAPPVPAKE